MVKMPKDTEVMMYGDKKPAAGRADIIRFDRSGNPIVERGGTTAQGQPTAPAAPTTAPAAAAAPAAPSAPVRPRSPANAKDQSRAVARNAVTSFMTQMRDAAAAKGGMLSLADIDAMQASFAEQAKAMESEMEKALESFASARERLQWNVERNDPFYRLVVKNFSHLFKEKPSRKTVTRRMLPGFFMALGMILGPDLVANYRTRCKTVLDRVKGDRNDFDWDEFYGEKDVLSVRIDAQLVIAAQFSDYDRRSNWFITLVNSNLAAPGDGASSELAQWELTEPAFRRFLDALLGDVRKLLSSDKGRERLAKRHGAETVASALKTLKRLITG